MKRYSFTLVHNGPARTICSDSNTRALVNNFDETYLAAISAPFANIRPKTGIRIKATIGGQQRFDVHKSGFATRELRWDQLQSLRRASDLSVVWLNMCDIDHSAIKPLIAKLRSLIEASAVQAKKEEMNVMIRRMSVRSTRVLNVGINLRVRCCRKELPASSQWQDPVFIRDAEDGDLWRPFVSLKSSVSTDFQIDYVRLGKRSAIVYEGLSWEIIQIQDEYALRVSIPTL